MDIISHGLYGGIAFGRKSRKSFWTSFCFGIAPDFIAFAPFFLMVILGFTSMPDFSTEPPPVDRVPPYVHGIYNVTHSFVVFALLFVLLWVWYRKPLWESLAWPLHILVDIPTHSYHFFPTPFLWPIADVRVDGIRWATPMIFIPNIILLLALYGFYFFRKKRNAFKRTSA